MATIAYSRVSPDFPLKPCLSGHMVNPLMYMGNLSKGTFTNSEHPDEILHDADELFALCILMDSSYCFSSPEPLAQGELL